MVEIDQDKAVQIVAFAADSSLTIVNEGRFGNDDQRSNNLSRRPANRSFSEYTIYVNCITQEFNALGKIILNISTHVRIITVNSDGISRFSGDFYSLLLRTRYIYMHTIP